MKKIKLLLISADTSGSPGGIATWTRIYLESCKKNDIECSLVNTAQIGKRSKQGNSRIRLMEEFVRTKNIFRNLNQYLKRKKFEVAHINSSCSPLGLIRDYICVKKIKKRGIRIVVHFHCDIPFWIHNGINAFFLKRLLAISDKVLVLCDNSKKYLKEKYNIESEKVPNFVNPNQCINTEHMISDSIQRLLFVGYIQPEKGVKEIYELAKIFTDKEFLLAGEVRSDIARIDKPINVELLGRLNKENVIRLMDRADVFLFPTHSEGFSMALSEAMCRGLPAVATNVGANLDMLENKGGIVVEKENVRQMSNAILKMESPDIRRKMSRWSINKIRTSYITDIVMKQLVKIYRSDC